MVDENIYESTKNVNGVLKLFMIKASVGILVFLGIVQELVAEFGKSLDDIVKNYMNYLISIFTNIYIYYY